MSELDEENKKRLIKLLEKFEQVFITSTQLNINGAKQFQLKEKPKEGL